MAPAPNRTVIIFLFALGVAVAVAAHLGARAAQRRARKAYRDLVGHKSDLPDDHWQDIRPLVGPWGCLSTVLAFLRGIGVVLALAAALYLIAGA